MLPVVFGLLMVLGCLFLSVCVTVLTFTVVDVRRMVTATVARLEVLGDRNHATMVKTMEIAAENQRALIQIRKRLRLSEGDESGD